MPIARVDHDERRVQLARIVWRIWADEGLSAVTVRRLAGEIGASTTIITQAFTSRHQMLDFTIRRRAQEWRAESEAIVHGGQSARERLRKLLLAQCPLTPCGIEDTRVWLALLAQRTPPQSVEAAALIEDYNRQFRSFVEALLGEIRGDPRLVGVLQALVWGICAATAESPDDWPAERMEASIDRVLRAFDLCR